MSEDVFRTSAIEAFGLVASLLVVSYLIAEDARMKGRSRWFWGLLCFFTGFLALPVYFLITSNHKGK